MSLDDDESREPWRNPHWVAVWIAGVGLAFTISTTSAVQSGPMDLPRVNPVGTGSCANSEPGLSIRDRAR